MANLKLRPITPGQRHKVKADFDSITTNKPEKSLTAKLKKSGGRNNEGKMTVRNIGGGHKRRYRIIDFKRDKRDIQAEVKTVEYDPNRSARIALVEYSDGEKRYILCPKDLKVGDKIMSGENVPATNGNSMPLSKIPLGTQIHNIEMTPGKGGALSRSAGNFAVLKARDGKYAILKMPSGEVRKILLTCYATMGIVSNENNFLTVSGKAGRRRWLGRRPRVRGVAMNPVDHPMGGGEGRQSGGHPRSRNGIPAKGFKTRNKKKNSNRLIIKRAK